VKSSLLPQVSFGLKVTVIIIDVCIHAGRYSNGKIEKSLCSRLNCSKQVMLSQKLQHAAQT